MASPMAAKIGAFSPPNVPRECSPGRIADSRYCLALAASGASLNVSLSIFPVNLNGTS